jgi:selenocysteine-specific elongation factor
MSFKYYTIGMAGHIDHGKTSLTKALTNVETDRLKEEKERSISIELGYAPFELNEEIKASVIDVPGHERFIRQMIAGVAGIDLVVLVIAADEGIMPQTKEHLEILSFLGIENGVIALTKVDRVDDELLELVTEDIEEQLQETCFAEAPIIPVDSISHTGIDDLKKKITDRLYEIEGREAFGAFRLPIDQVFSVQGQGTVVRGTVYEGKVHTGNQLMILPSGKKAKIRQMQVHHKEVNEAQAGQRVAINLGGVSKNEVNRGDVLVSSNQFVVTNTIDICMTTVQTIETPLKQRAPIKLHIGTKEVMGTIVFFDRNELVEDETEVLCQLRLNEDIVTKRGDRFILRRPTPVETVAGGWVIDPAGGKYRFGEKTIEMLARKKEGSASDRVLEALNQRKLLQMKELMKETSLNEAELIQVFAELSEQIVSVQNNVFAAKIDIDQIKHQVIELLEEFHHRFEMRQGLNKAELIQSMAAQFPKALIEYTIEDMVNDQTIKKEDQYLSLTAFEPQLPDKWKARMKEVVGQLEKDKLEVKSWDEYMNESKIPKELHDEFKHYLIQSREAYPLGEKLLVHKTAVDGSISLLQRDTNYQPFAIKDAKESLNLSRKFLIPFLELLDDLKVTKRDGDKREWVS